MKKFLAFLLTAAILVGGGGAFYHFYYKDHFGSASEGRVSSDSEDAVYVTSVSVIAGLGSGSGVIQRYGGEVVAQETWEAKLTSDRTVKETYVQVGDQVQAGEKLFSYDISEEEDKIAQDEIDVERAEYEIKTMQSTLENLEKQLAKATKEEDKASYENQILSEQNSIKLQELEIKSKQLEIETLKEGLDNADVVSKIDGVVKSISSSDSESSSVSSSDTSDAYITIMATGDYRVQGTVNEQNYSNIYEGASVICYSRVDSSLYWLGTISEISKEAESSSSDSYYESSGSSSYPFYIELDNSDGLLLGQHLYIELDQGQLYEKEGIWIPDYYITMEEDGTAWVWAASSKNVLEKRTVELGEYDEGELTYEILSGITEDDYLAAVDEQNEEGGPVIYNEASGTIYPSSDEEVYDGFDAFGDGSYDDYYYYDDGSLDWDDWDDEDWEWDDEDLEDYSAYDEDDWEDWDIDGSVYVFDDEEWDDADSEDDAVDVDWDEEDDAAVSSGGGFLFNSNSED